MKISLLPRRARNLRALFAPPRFSVRDVPAHALRATVTTAALLMLGAAAPAQTPANAPAPLTAAPLPPIAPDISVLIVPLDNLGVPATPLTLPPLPAPPLPAPATPIAPIAPTGADAVTPVTPTSVANATAAGLWQWRVAAQKKSKADKKREKEAEANRKFNLDPAPITKYKKPDNTTAGNTTAGNTTGALKGADVSAAGLAIDNPAGDATVAAPGALLAAPLIPQGPSQMMALSLRRNLAARGYRDVQVATTEDAILSGAISGGRLSSRVLSELRRAMSQLATAPDSSALIMAGRAATRIGQATGYRSVVVFNVGAPTQIGVVGAGIEAGATTQKVALNLVISDAQRESTEPASLVETGDTEAIWRESGAAAGAELLDKTLRDWPVTSRAGQAQLAQLHFGAAQSSLENGNLERAQDELNQALSLDPTNAQGYVTRGDLLLATDPVAASLAYKRSLELNASDGATWAKVAAAYAYATPPDFRAAKEAGERALALNYDSAPLRVALATAEYGRADLFRQYLYPNRAEDAEAAAGKHLDRAIVLAPDDPSAGSLLARNLMAKRNFAEAVRVLDRIGPRFPNDPVIQSQYALALGSVLGREQDAFAAYARVWKLAGNQPVTLDPVPYRLLASGFDERLYNLGKFAVQLASNVSTGAVLRESALLQLSKLKEEMDAAQQAIAVMQPNGAVSVTTSGARVFAAAQMSQALEAFQTYLETGQSDYRTRGLELYRLAVGQLNTARLAQ